jgi:predicted PurR-regulated permease PerM
MRKIERHIWFWLAALVVLIGCLMLLRGMLLPFIAGIGIAYFLNPIADALERMGFGRTLAALLIVGLVGVAIVLAAFVLGPMIADQLRRLAVALPENVDKLRTMIEAMARERLGGHFPKFQTGLEKALAELSQNWAGSAGSVMAALWDRGLALMNVVSLLLITPLVVFYLLVDWHPMLDRIDGWLPREHAPTIRRLAGDINAAISAFVRGQGAICLLLGIFYAIGLSWAGVSYGLLIGLATGIAGFVPIVGWVLGTLVAGGLALIENWPSLVTFLMVLGVMLAGMALDTALLSPRFVGQKIGVHPVWLIFALMAFSYLFGFVGTLVAVPVAAAIGVLVRHAVDVYLASEFYGGPAAAGRAGGERS